MGQTDAVTDLAAGVPVRVAEVTAEGGVDEPPEIPWHLAGEPGRVQLQLRTTVRRVAVGAGLARRPDLLAAVRALPGVAAVVTSPAGGTFIVGGPAWLGLCAIGTPHPGQPMPLDWLVGALRTWLEAALRPLGLEPQIGRVEGAWCPGFSDVAVAGRKLAGLGFRVTRDAVVMRGVIAVEPIGDADWDLLVACHRLIDVELRRESSTSLVECTGDREWTVERGIECLRKVAVG